MLLATEPAAPRGPFVPPAPGEAGVWPTHTPAPRRRRRRRREVENPEFIAFARRILAAASRRVGGDLATLGDLAQLQADVDAAVDRAVAALRNDPDAPASWAEIGAQFGITRASAQQRFGHVGGARRPGGQPTHLRTYTD